MPTQRRSSVPAASPATARRPAASTGTIVALGVALLALLGVSTVFGRTIAALFATPSGSHDVDEPR